MMSFRYLRLNTFEHEFKNIAFKLISHRYKRVVLRKKSPSSNRPSTAKGHCKGQRLKPKRLLDRVEVKIRGLRSLRGRFLQYVLSIVIWAVSSAPSNRMALILVLTLGQFNSQANWSERQLASCYNFRHLTFLYKLTITCQNLLFIAFYSRKRHYITLILVTFLSSIPISRSIPIY